MVCPFFTAQPVVNFETARTSDLELFRRYFADLLDLGISLAPSQFEGMFVSTAHTDEDIELTIEAQGKALERALG
ncbi:Glutamate-1-semialdehyde 2,1-aminomutase [compost metagenome]